MARVLVVDDNLMVRGLLREILIGGGHQVVGEAGDGSLAPGLLRELRPEVVTLDIVMPGRSGLTTLPHLMMIDPSLTVVVCSASLSQSRVIDALRAGAKGFIVKPFDPRRVLDAVHEALSETHGLAAAIDLPPVSALTRFDDEKREFERIGLRLPVVIEASGRRQHTVSVNLSCGGMLLDRGTLAVGDRLAFRVHLGERRAPVDGLARVARSDEEGRPALAFERLAVADYERLVEFLYVAGAV